MSFSSISTQEISIDLREVLQQKSWSEAVEKIDDLYLKQNVFPSEDALEMIVDKFLLGKTQSER